VRDFGLIRQATTDNKPGCARWDNNKRIINACQQKMSPHILTLKKHLTFSPQSADVMSAHASDLADFVTSKSSFQFDVDKPLPKALLSKLLKARLAELS